MIMPLRIAFVLAPLFAMLACSSTDSNAPAGGDASTTDGGDAAADVGVDHASPDAVPTACDLADASKPECLRGGPCSCDDVVGTDAPAICVGVTWQCPQGYTRFQDCHGVPPSAGCLDGGEGGTTPIDAAQGG